MQERVSIGVIGGSGIYQMEALTDVTEVHIKTPFGDPSDAIILGTLAGRRIAFLPRHRRGHMIMPHELNSRANIYALKTLGVESIISVSACGSMRPDFAPRDIVIPDQLFDRTKARPNSFFGNGMVVHVGMADPFCPTLSDLLYAAVQQAGATAHKGGTFIVIDGPQFSTKAESRVYRQWGVDIIGMTALPEAKLAREAEICYACMAHVTDYDVWHETEEAVSVEMLIANLTANAAVTKRAIELLVPMIPATRECACSSALASAMITDQALIPECVKRDLAPLVGKYLDSSR